MRRELKEACVDFMNGACVEVGRGLSMGCVGVDEASAEWGVR